LSPEEGVEERRTRPRRFFLGWTVVLVAALAAFGEVAFYNPVLGVFIPEFEKEFGWSRTEISAAVTLGSLLGAVVATVSGPLIDRYGGKAFISGGSAIMAIGLVALSQMQTELQFFVIYAIGRASASGLIGLAAGVTVSKWFIQRRGFAVGVTNLGTRFGFMVMPIGVQLVIDAAEWRTAALTLAGCVVATGIFPAMWWLHSRPEHHGSEPDGIIRVDDPTVAPRVREVNWQRGEAMRTRAFWLLTAAVSLQNFAGGAINLHQIAHMVDRGLQPASAALVLSLVAAFAAAGALVEGFLDERIGPRRTMTLGLCGCALGMAVLLSVNGMLIAIAYAALYGVASGLMITSSQLVFANYFGRESLGAIRGAVAPIQMGLNAIGPIIAGLAHDQTGSYMAAFVPFACAYLVAAGALTVARRPVHPGGGEVRST
jgi:OFA family oxalate/formate antiporter-like MFS transporter